MTMPGAKFPTRPGRDLDAPESPCLLFVYDFVLDEEQRVELLDDGVLAAARKVIAVHINYPSRAAQRGRTPEQPSYFLKPSSSLAMTGAGVERPAGCELLAFEGEIALVIGTPARRVGPADAWSHVEWVTAGNDLGVYDLRSADKGSNLRSKGGDGFTPVGPGLLPADAGLVVVTHSVPIAARLAGSSGVRLLVEWTRRVARCRRPPTGRQPPGVQAASDHLGDLQRNS